MRREFARALLIFGTRPEAIKMAPVVRALQEHSGIEARVCVTAQHREMLDQVLELFAIEPDFDLDVMVPDQQLVGMTSHILTRLERVVAGFRPDLILVHGDTTTTLSGALAGYYHHIPVAHVEAGLRTGNMLAPWPEEGNRRVTTALSSLHFAPTTEAGENLRREGVDPKDIVVTGNTVIDALLMIEHRLSSEPALRSRLDSEFPMLRESAPLILITGHRRENFGAGLRRICKAILELSEEFLEADFVYPVHLNPNVKGPVHDLLEGPPNIHLIEPLEYLPFVYLMSKAHILLTDSGGVQEEAPALNKPVLVMRDTTERPEGLEAGTLRLVGTDPRKIRDGVRELMRDDAAYDRMARAENPYGDGKAAARIRSAVERFLEAMA